MATLDFLKLALRQRAPASSPKRDLSDTEYSAGFPLLVQGPASLNYHDFIIPKLAQLLASLANSHGSISILEIGPGAKSILRFLPSHLRQKIKKYTAFEPNDGYVKSLEEWVCSTSEGSPPMPCLESPPQIHHTPFSTDIGTGTGIVISNSDSEHKYDVILFCHSMYGMHPKRRFIETALELLVEQPQAGLVIVFHREGNIQLDGLVCHQTASFPAGVVHIKDDDAALDHFARIMAGFVMQSVDEEHTIRAEWREVCRDLGSRAEDHPGYLLFSNPDLMMVFTRHATALAELTEQVPLAQGNFNGQE
ncbi:hypothetical protein H2200_009950 [Cladophialophora chaetospira]|uniref:Uncharacterized protein n=1 Tax=Cladophialophora chaetospira TaxID=386627 RepID=A0AA38X220_9EURO|nr:hypothetical protein H2200_009950 [Cladophialophora chaetospira]